MNERFNNYKKQAWRNVFIKCALSAATVALWAVDVVMLSCLLSDVQLFFVWYLLIAIGACALGFGVSFAILRLSDRKIAERLDAEFNLEERVQTAYAYQNEQSVMLDLQRNDTDNALSRISDKKLRFGSLISTVMLPVLLVIGIVGLSVLAVLITPKDSNYTPPVEPPREVTDWEWQALDDLIEYVKASEKADSQAKDGMVTALEGLRSVLQNGVSQSSLSVFVQNTVTEITNAVSAANDRDGVSEAQKSNNDEERDYVITRLREIFSLQNSDGTENSGSENGNKDDEEPVSPGNNTGTGELIISGVPFFDPDLGYVSSGDPETREKYYDIIRKAMQEGAISRTEWENIVATYFADLQEKEN